MNKLIQLKDSLGNLLFPKTQSNEAWKTPTFQNNWMNFAGTYQKAGYYKHDGIVYLRGLVKSGAMQVAMFTLPVGYRPALDEIFSVGSEITLAYCFINTIGEVRPVAGSTNWFSISGISFRVD
jgi:hypothetical protein